MNKKQSAGILLYRTAPTGELQVFLAHPGGPFFTKKDAGYWGIPKGLFENDEDPQHAAYREFREEIGRDAPTEGALELQPLHRTDGKTIYAWAVEDTTGITFLESNTFEMEWPPRSGKKMAIPEIDRAEWFTLDEAREKISGSQTQFLDELEQKLGTGA